MGIPSPVRRLTQHPCLDFGLEPVAATPEKPVASVQKQPARATWVEQDHRLVLRICAFAGGPTDARHVAAISSAFRKAVSKGWTELVDGFNFRLYVVGGLDGDYRPVATVQRLNPLLQSWEDLPPLAVPRAGACAVAAGGHLYVLGGEANGQALCDAQRFDPWTHRWESLPVMRAARIRAAAVAAGSYLFVIGGLDGSRALRSFERYEPQSRKWQELPPMQRARYACCAAASGRWIFAFGGEVAEAGALGSMERYDRETGHWEALPPLQAPGCGATTVLAPSGRAAFSLGGLGLSGQAQGVAKRLALDAALLAAEGEAEEAAEGAAEREPLRWSCLPPMPTPRHQASAAAFRGGAVAVGGKGARFEPAAAVELFDPRRWAWEALPDLPSPRLRVAVAGGRL